MRLVLCVLITVMRAVDCQEWLNDLTDEQINEVWEQAIEERSFNGRVVGGRIVEIFKHPYMAQVMNEYETVIGGGTIINRRWIVTAAHLEEGSPVAAVLVGSDRRNQGRKIKVSMIKHEKWAGAKENFWRDDIALLKLEEPLEYSKSIRPIRLPTKQSQLDRGEHAHVLGFGLTEKRVPSERLLIARLRILDDSICHRVALARSEPEVDFAPRRHLCAANFVGRRDSCNGDSGGPLVVRVNKSEHVLIGIVSYGPGNCTAFARPAFYTRVSTYVDWILRTIIKNDS